MRRVETSEVTCVRQRTPKSRIARVRHQTHSQPVSADRGRPRSSSYLRFPQQVSPHQHYEGQLRPTSCSFPSRFCPTSWDGQLRGSNKHNRQPPLLSYIISPPPTLYRARLFLAIALPFVILAWLSVSYRNSNDALKTATLPPSTRHD